MKRLSFVLLLVLLLSACGPVTPASRTLLAAPNANDIVLDPSRTYSNYTVTASGYADDPIVIWGNGAMVKCLSIKGNYVTVDNVIATGCSSHGILVSGKNDTVLNSYVYGNVTENGTGPCPGTGSWGSGIKGAVGAENLTVRYNTVFANCGEGIALTRVVGGEVANNTVYDNFSVNIYIDNSNGVIVHDNRSLCYDSRFYRNNAPARGVTLAAEYYAGWGFQFRDVLVEKNYVERCGGPRWYAPRFPNDQGTNVTVRDNWFSGVPSPQVALPTWMSASNNVVVTVTPSTVGSTPTQTVTFTPAPPTATRSATLTRTPTVIPSPITLTSMPPVSVTPTLECYTVMSSVGTKVQICFP